MTRAQLAVAINSSERSVERWERGLTIMTRVYEPLILAVLDPGSKTVAEPKAQSAYVVRAREAIAKTEGPQ